MRRLLVLAALLVALPARAFTVTQITNNSTGDWGPAISGSNVVWTGSDGNDSEIYYWDGSFPIQPIQITHNSTGDSDAAISGSNVVWTGWDGNDDEIYLWDGSFPIQIEQITDNSTHDYSPDISGPNVVWQCEVGNDNEICFWDGFTITQITNNSTGDWGPAISGSNVVWTGCDGGTGWDCSGGDHEIYFWDGFFPIQIDQITDNSTTDVYPVISESNVAWSGCDDRTGPGFNCSGFSGDQEIHLWDGSFPIQIEQITDNSIHDYSPDISGPNVVWAGCNGGIGPRWSCSGGNYEIYLWDGSTITQVTNNSSYEGDPSISGSNVVWTGSGGNDDGEIYMMTIPGTPIPTPTPVPPAPLTEGQQACVNQMNKSGEKVSKAQLKENEKCLKDFQKGKLPRTFAECIGGWRQSGNINDFLPGMKWWKAVLKTKTGEDKKCDSLAAAPHFAYTDTATVNQYAVRGVLALTFGIFGDPLQDADLATKAGNKDVAKCQLEMLKQASKVGNAVLKEVNKAKKNALKEATTSSSSALAAELEEAFSSNKITKAAGALEQQVDKKCAGLGSPDTLFPGACADAVLDNVSDCVIAAARCEACLEINAMDSLSLDCDDLDDGNANASCP